MDAKGLHEFFIKLKPEQQQELLNRLGRIDLATSINKDQEFINETIEDFLKDYPEIQMNI